MNFWDERFSQEAYVYGEEPNAFLKSVLNVLKPGKMLIPGEGEGRNAVYSAAEGWDVHAFDQSVEGRKKAMQLADKKGVTISYTISDYQSFESDEEYDAVVLVFTHMSPEIRPSVHSKFIKMLKPGGHLIMQVFRKEQLGLDSGGPKDIDMLMSKEEAEADFAELTSLSVEEEDVHLHEGAYHEGFARVLSIKGIR